MINLYVVCVCCRDIERSEVDLSERLGIFERRQLATSSRNSRNEEGMYVWADYVE